MTTRGHHGLLLADATGVTYDTLSPTNKDSRIVLASGDLVARSNTTASGTVLSVASYSSGKRGFYFRLGNVPGNQYAAAGIKLSTASITDPMGVPADSYGVWRNGVAANSYTFNNNNLANISPGTAGTTGDYFGALVDIGAGKVWLIATARGGTGIIGGGNPVTGTSPTYSFTGGSTVYAACSPYSGDATPTLGIDLTFLPDPADWPTSWAGFAGWAA